MKWKTLGLGEIVDANRMASTAFKLDFKMDVENEVVCVKKLTQEEQLKFRKVSAVLQPRGSRLVVAPRGNAFRSRARKGGG